jgi:hypothetical protein
MKSLTLGIVLALMPLTAVAAKSDLEGRGFTLDEMANFAREAPQDDQIKAARKLFAETETLRAAFVINPARTFSALSSSEREVLQLAANPSTERRMLALHWFMRGGIAKASIIDNALLSGIYHPVAQVWMLIRWDRSGGRWSVADAAFVPANALADGARADPADLPSSYQRAIADFVQVTQDIAVPTIMGSRIGDRTVAQAAAFERIDAVVATLGRLYGEPAQVRALAGLRKSFGEQSDTMSAARALPSQARISLAPVAATRTANGVRVWLSSPLASSTLLAADWAEGDFGKRPVVRAVLLDRLAAVQATSGVGQ